MNAEGYIRCHYVSPQSIECASWFPRNEGNLCVVHRGIVSPQLAANGHNKDEFIENAKKVQQPMRDLIAGKERPEQCSILDEHIAKVEKIVEEQKLIASSYRALRSEVIEGMTAEEIQERRKMRVPVSERVAKVKAAPKDDKDKAIMKAAQELMRNMLRQGKSINLEGALVKVRENLEMFGLD